MKKSLKKVLLLAVAVIVLSVCLVFSASAAEYSGTCGENVTWSLDTDTEVLTISGEGAMADYDDQWEVPWYDYRSDIKSVIIESGVTTIGNYSFYSCIYLANISIPDSVTSIGSNAFDNWDSLTVDENNEYYSSDEYGVLFNKEKTTLILCPDAKTSYEIPDSVTSIDDEAFSWCTSLESITIPDSVTSIGYSAFENCGSLTSITIPDSVTSVGGDAFSWCSNLTEVTIGNSVTSIGEGAFGVCSNLTEVTIGNSVTSIGDSAFEHCYSLTSITIPDSVASIGRYAFSWCSNLTEVTIGNGVTDISDSAFNACTRLESITIPDSVTTIGGNAFYYCTSLESITIPDSVTSIGDSAFEKCYSLTSITIPDSVTSIGDSAFENCYSLTSITIPDSVASIGRYAFSGCSNLTEVIIGNGVTDIGYYAFSGCSNLTEVIIGNGVTSIDTNAFSGCYNIERFVVDSENQSYSSDEYGVLFDKEKITLILCPYAKTSYEIPDSVASIGRYAFSGCSNLTEVTIPDSVTSIGYSAFENCDSLISVTIPDSVTNIGNRVFFNCDKLESVTIDSENQNYSIDEYGMLFNKDKTTLIYFIENKTTSYSIPDSVTSVGGYAFYGCSNLTEVIIPESVTTIEEWAFYCSALKNIIVDKNNKYYSNDESGVLFNKDKTVLIQYPIGRRNETYSIPLSVTSTASSAFAGGSILVLMIENLNLEEYDFSNCVIGGVVLPEGITSVCTSGFSECISLSAIFLPESVSVLEMPVNNSWVHAVIYYAGTSEEWENVDYDIYNFSNVYMNYEFSSCEHKYSSNIVYTHSCFNPYQEFYTCECGITLIIMHEPTGEHKTIYEYDLKPCEVQEEGVGIRREICYLCDSILAEIAISITPSDHLMSDWSLTTESTCGQSGTETRYCTYGCGYSETRDIATIEHTMSDWSVDYTSTCSSVGRESRYCTNNCGHRETREIAKLEHSMSSWTTDWSATCTNTGRESRYCTNNCGNYEYNEIPVINHSMSAWTEDYPASCTSTGSESRTCTYGCGHTEYNEIPMIKHSMSGWTVSSQATCTASGNQYRECTYGCGHQEHKELKATGHSDGNRDGYCDNCGEVIKTEDCSCNCHATGIKAFFYKIARFFWKLFKTNKYCSCGVSHY